MEKWVLLFVVMFNLQAFAQDEPDSWIGVDCGANRSTSTNGLLWQSDETFIQTGSNHLIPDQETKPLAILNTLRAFTQQNKNCYTLPAQSEERYFLRAVFFYANYDSLSKPPTFDLQIDGNKWATIVSSSTEVLYYEILYYSQKPNISVCLARTQNDQFPFISSLEAWKVSYTMYNGMSQDLAWLKSYRYNYGPNDGIIWYPDDSYNRIWEPMYVPGYYNTTADPGTEIYYGCDESPPDSAILDAIEGQNGTSLFLSFNPVKANTPIYVAAYFTEMQSDLSGTRSFDIYCGDKKLDTVVPDYNTCTAKEGLVQALNSSLSIELRPTATTSQPPIISAVEIYTAGDPLVSSGTDPDDLNGLAAFTSKFDQLKGWSGDPCLPENSVWQWLSCSGSDPPRVTSINLSGYGLNGNLSDFSQMQALEDIDLSNNSLTGQIPDFLGQLPNLKKLNLSYNDFSGLLPSSIRDNRGLAYYINGNPNVDPSGPSPAPNRPSNSTSPPSSSSSSPYKTIGIAIPIVIVLAVVVWFIRRRLRRLLWQCCNRKQNQNPNPDPAPEPGIGNGFMPDSFMNSAAHLIPSRPTSPTDEEECVPVGTPPNAETAAPDVDLNELAEMVDQHTNGSSHANYQTSGGHSIVTASNHDQALQSDSGVEEVD